MKDAAIASDDAGRRALADKVLGLVNEGPCGDPAAFDDLALEVFAYQYESNRSYREFCDASETTPAGVGSWRDIPAYPTDAFKHEIVASFPVGEAVMAQLTSGTTSANQRGRIFRDEVGRELVFAANRAMTAAYLFPDLAEGTRCRILILAPSPELAPSMGMAIGMEQTRRAFGTKDSAFVVGRGGVDVKVLVDALRQAEATGVPVALIGATSAFVYFLKAAERKGLRFSLPEGSRLCDGGGYRGRFGEVTRDDYHRLAEALLGVPAPMCVNTLGLAESATNYFDDSLRNHVLGLGGAPRRKLSPPWARTQAVGVETGDVLPPGEVGLLRHYDLVNLPTVIAVQSDNLGVVDERGGFEIVGRAKVVDGKVSPVPSELPVGPMGDRRVFRLLEAYVNFSIDFKMGRVKSSDEKADYLELRREQDEALGVSEAAGEATPSCPTVVEDLVAGAEDPRARERAERALGISERDGEGT
ncbi:MAG TPA: acyl-protein synthetase [Coriobacteriia bacterium]|jgi:hypothetical protein